MSAGVAQRQGEAIDVLGDTQLLAGDLDGDGQSGGRRSGGDSNDHIPQQAARARFSAGGTGRRTGRKRLLKFDVTWPI